MSDQCTEELFFRDIEKHSMTIIRDDGAYRHIRFSRGSSSVYQFDFITWPGYLCYCGDMGTYVFRRLEDMFEFFRTDRKYAAERGHRLSINLGYWSEKLVAVDGGRRNGSAKEFSPEKFERIVKEQLGEWLSESELDAVGCRELREAVEEDVLRHVDDGEYAAYHAAHHFQHGRYQFHDFFFEHDFTEYTFHFVWCCYALAWGIQQYDDSKAAAA